MPTRIVYELPASAQDLTGKTFGRWTVVRFDHGKLYGKDTRHNYWECRCSCPAATVKVVSGPSLSRGDSLSCGCLRLERIKEANTTHGLTTNGKVHPLRNAHFNMMNRCYNENVDSYPIYGGRGIKVAKRWHTFENFLADMGPTWSGVDSDGEPLSLDRISTDSDYGPGLCKWSTNEEQANNVHKNVYLTWNGKTQTAARWARELNMPPQNIISRKQKLGWSDEECLTTPIKHKAKQGSKKKNK